MPTFKCDILKSYYGMIELTWELFSLLINLLGAMCTIITYTLLITLEVESDSFFSQLKKNSIIASGWATVFSIVTFFIGIFFIYSSFVYIWDKTVILMSNVIIKCTMGIVLLCCGILMADIGRGWKKWSPTDKNETITFDLALGVTYTCDISAVLFLISSVTLVGLVGLMVGLCSISFCKQFCQAKEQVSPL